MNRFEELVARAKEHRDQNMLKAGIYGKTINGEFRGGAVCCLAHDIPDFKGSKYKSVAKYYEYPVWLVHLQESVFEGLPNRHRASWHVEFAEALAASNISNWGIVMSKVLIGILQLVLPASELAARVVCRVITLHERVIAGKVVTQQEWSDAADAASYTSSAAAYAASCHDYYYDCAVAVSATYAVGSAEKDAAEKAAAYSSYSAAFIAGKQARKQKWLEIRDITLDALKEPC